MLMRPVIVCNKRIWTVCMYCLQEIFKCGLEVLIDFAWLFGRF